MANRAAVAAFVLSLLGVAYQMMAYGLAYLVDNRFNYNSYYYGLNNYFSIFAVLVGFWAISHLLDSRGSQVVAWSAIILALGATILGNLIIAWITPNGGPVLFAANQEPSAGVAVTLLVSPVLLIVGGILGFLSARRPNQ